MTYYNLHTHSLTPASSHIFSICNLPGNPLFHNPETYPDTYFSAGIHPWNINTENVKEQLEQLQNITALSQIVAIGECGLDKLTKTPLPQQQTIFRQQAEIAREHQKPVIIHCVKAFNELIQIHREIKPPQPWIIHGFRGKPQLAAELMQHGLQISIGHLFNPAIAKVLPASSLLLETDENDTPIETLYQQAATIWNLSEKKLSELIEKQFKMLFRLPG